MRADRHARRRAQLQIERRHLVAARRADPRPGCARPRRSRSGAMCMHGIHQSMYLQAGLRERLAHPVHVEAEHAGRELGALLALVRLALRRRRRASAPASARGHARRRRRRRRRSRRPGCTSAPAQTTGMLTEPSVALTVPLALIAWLQTGKPISVSALTSRTPPSMTSAARAARLEATSPADRRRSRRCIRR